MKRRFDLSYRESVTLGDGRVLELRLVRPDDKALLLAGFSRQSHESRFRRFFTDKESLTEGELKYLTEVDGESHFALGAVEATREGAEGRGIARFIRLRDRPEVADWAIAVDDAIQGKGLGRILFQRLCTAAHERGVERLRCDVLAFNEPMRKLISQLAPDAIIEDQGLVVGLEFPVPEPGDDPSQKNALYRVLALAAEGLIAVGRRLLSLPGRLQHEGVRDHDD